MADAPRRRVRSRYYPDKISEEEQARRDAVAALEPELDLREGSPAYKFNPQEAPGRFINELLSQAETREFDSQPEIAGLGPRFQRQKMANARRAGLQQAYVMEQALAAYGKPINGMFPESWRQLPDALTEDMYAYATNKDGYRDRLNSPTEYTGVLGEGSPVNTALTWGQSIPSMIYAAGENIGNATDYVVSSLGGGIPGKQFPDAGKNFAYALNTFTAPGQALAEAAGYAPPIEEGHSAWSDMKDARQELDDQTTWNLMGHVKNPYGPTPYDAMQYGNLSREAQAVDLQEGKDYFMGQGVPETPAYFLGMATDDLLNPLFDAPGIAAASKTGRLLPIAKQLGIEFAPGQVMTGVGVAAQIRARQLEEQAKRDALIERLR